MLILIQNVQEGILYLSLHLQRRLMYAWMNMLQCAATDLWKSMGGEPIPSQLWKP